MVNESKRQRYEKIIAQFCLIDDTFMAKVFENNIPGTEILLHTILENDKIKVIKAVGQYAVKNLQGRSVRLDIYAQDEQGRHFNVEVQRLNAGALPQRARYYVDLLDANHFEAGKDFARLQDCYVIFITEQDVLGYGLPLYHIDRTIRENGASFDDGAHIIYVNGARRSEDTPLGRLLHDFFCTELEEMYNKELAERTRYFKEDEGGVGEMCELMEALAREEALEAAKEARYEEKVEIAERALMRGMSIDDTVALTDLTKEEVEQIAERLAQKHSA